MGNKNSKGEMLVALENVSVSPGDELIGHVYFQLNESIRKQSALFLQFSGVEFVKWSSGIFSDCEGKNILKKEQKKIMTWEKGLKKGQYDIPFTFILPEVLHSSFYLKEEKYSANLYYKINGILVSKDRKMKNTVKFEVINTNIIERVPIGIFKQYVIKRCCFKNSEFEVKGEISKNIYFSNEILEFELQYNNSKSSLNIDSILVSFLRRIRLKTNKAEVAQYTKSLMTCEVPSIRAGNPKTVVFKGSFNLIEMSKTLAESRSILTEMILCKYFLSISHHISGSCVTQFPDLQFEIAVVPDKACIEPQQFESPSDWNPHSFPCARLSYKEFAPSAPVLELEE